MRTGHTIIIDAYIANLKPDFLLPVSWVFFILYLHPRDPHMYKNILALDEWASDSESDPVEPFLVDKSYS
jgi:hypothetical protein